MQKSVKISFILLCLSIALVLSIFFIGLFRTLTFKSPDNHFGSGFRTKEAKLSRDVLNRLSKAIQIKTVSSKEYSKTDFSQFDNFLSFLKKTYPNVFKKLEYIPVNKYGILLIYRAGNKFQQKDEAKPLPILITGHYDTVDVDKNTINDWKYKPYEGKIAEEKIWGRGTLDDKSSVIAIFEAVDFLLKTDFKPMRDVYFAFGHDEETGGVHGAKKIAEYLEKKGVQFDMVLDEGGRVDIEEGVVGIDAVTAEKTAYIGIAEKGRFAFDILVKGNGGHASRPMKTSSVTELARMVQILNKHRMKPLLSDIMLQYYKLTFSKYDFYTKFLIANSEILTPLLARRLANNSYDNAYVGTTTAFTMLEGSMASNVIPNISKVTADFRILPTQKRKDVEKHISDVMKKYAPDIEYEIKPFFDEAPSKISPRHNLPYKKLIRAIAYIIPDANFVPVIVTGGTDARHYENVSGSIYRFLPIIVTDREHALMHSVDEYISEDNFSRLIEFYKRLMVEY